MKRILAFVLAYFCLSLGIMAHPVDLETAKTVAVKFMQTDRLDLCTLYPTDRGLPAFYVFNTQDGFVIVSADDCETPIIGYSHEGLFDPDNLPEQMEDYLQNFVERIQYGVENQVMADEITLKQWELVKVKGRLNDDRQATTVAPLITSRWHQGCLYNLFCPVQEGMECDHASVGCVAWIDPEYLTFEFISRSRAEQEAMLKVQLDALKQA